MLPRVTFTRVLNTSRDGESATSLDSLLQCLTIFLVKNFFPGIQPKPPLMKLEAITSHPVTCSLEEDNDPHLATTSFKVAAESKKSSEPLSQFSQPLLKQPCAPDPSSAPVSFSGHAPSTSISFLW